MIHPQTQLRFINEQVGYGVFATAFIPAGTLTYVQDALEIAIPAESRLLQDRAYRPLIDKYATIEPDGRRLISWDIAKYVNHCCRCNTMSTGYGFEIALRDIAAGEQITDEYGLFNLEWEMDLVCDQAGCRRRLQRGDFDAYVAAWDAQVQAALARCLSVEQPLWPFLDAAAVADLMLYLTTGENYKSLATLRPAPAPDYGRFHPPFSDPRLIGFAP